MGAPQGISREKVEEADDFIRGTTTVLALLPMGYGILSFLFGEALWGNGNSTAYQAALSAPLAPESWGAFALLCGAIILWAEFAEKFRAKAVACFAQGVWCLTFASFFFFDCISRNTVFGSTAVLIWTAFASIYLWRSRLAWKWS